MATNPTCNACQFFVPPGREEMHGECHAPVPMWVHAEFNYKPGTVDANFPAQRCGLFAAAAPARGGARSPTGEPGSALSLPKRTGPADAKLVSDGAGPSQV